MERTRNGTKIYIITNRVWVNGPRRTDRLGQTIPRYLKNVNWHNLTNKFMLWCNCMMLINPIIAKIIWSFIIIILNCHSCQYKVHVHVIISSSDIKNLSIMASEGLNFNQNACIYTCVLQFMFLIITCITIILYVCFSL